MTLEKKMDRIQLLHGDCMELMANTPDKFYDLAIVDPPYGINAGVKTKYHANANTYYIAKDWDKNIPDTKYFNELFRVSKDQIIWGGNYFYLPAKPKWIVWDKCQPEGIDQAMFELAWCSIEDIQASMFRRSPAADNNKVSNGDRRLMSVAKRIHPTQKPIQLYKWLLNKYATPDMNILDTHLGSGSSSIAAHYYGCKFTGIEIDKDYYDAAVKRFNLVTSQQQLF